MYLLATSTLIAKPLYGVATAGFFYFVFSFVRLLVNLFKLVICKTTSKKTIGTIKKKTPEMYDGKVIDYVYDVDVEFEGETIKKQRMTIKANEKKNEKYSTDTQFDVYWNSKSEKVVDKKQLVSDTIGYGLSSLAGIGTIVLVFVILDLVK